MEIRKITLCLFISGILLTVFAQVDYKYKTIEDFPTLEDFGNIDKFEAYYKKYVQDCLDNTMGGSGGIPCYLGDDLWDRELNIYYQRLREMLSPEDQIVLRDAQRAWITERDLTLRLTSAITNDIYPSDGTMWQLLSAGDSNRIAEQMAKDRTLIFIQLIKLSGVKIPQ